MNPGWIGGTVWGGFGWAWFGIGEGGVGSFCCLLLFVWSASGGWGKGVLGWDTNRPAGNSKSKLQFCICIFHKIGGSSKRVWVCVGLYKG